MLRCVVGHILRELIEVLTLGILVAPRVAGAQDKPVFLDELVHAGSLQH